MARRITSPVLVGRAAEQACLDAALGSVREGRPGTVLIAGEAGVGKTRLVADFVTRVAGGVRVLAGACIDEQIPYAPVAYALRSLVRSGWEPSDVGERGWGELERLLPELEGTRGSPRRDGGVSGELHGAFLRLLEELCRERVVLLIVEDLHWSDASTRNLLTYTMRAAGDIPLLIVATYRSDELTRRHPLRSFVAEAARLPFTELVELERLDRTGVAELLAELLDSQPTPGMVDEVYGRCGGNPFLVEEVIAAGVDHSGPLSPRLHDVLLARTTSLSPAAWSVLGAAAVGGQRTDDGLLRRVCQLDTGELDVALQELLDSHVLEPDIEARGYVFRHALTAQAVYESVLPGERVRLHVAFAEAIRDDPDLAAAGGVLAAVERAGHWHRARHSREALGAWVAAAAAAEAVYAPPEASAAYENALELWPIVDGAEELAGMDEVELLRRAAEAAYHAGTVAHALAHAQKALALVDEQAEPLRAAALTERLGSFSWSAGREQDSLAFFQRAVELVPESPPSAVRAHALAGHARILMLHWIDTAAAQRAEEAIDVARQVGAVAAEAHALNTLAIELGVQGDEAAALQAMEESARLSERSGDDENIARLWNNHTNLLLCLGDLETAASVAGQGAGVLRDRGLGRNFALSEIYGALPLIELGYWSEARALLDDAVEEAQSGWSLAWPLLSRAWLHWLTGDIDAAERDFDEIPRLAPDLISGQFIAAQARASAASAVSAEHWEKAVEAVADVVRRIPVEGGHPVVHWEAMIAAWLGLWAAAELMRERGTAGSAWLAPHLVQFDGLLTSAARRPLDRQTVRHRAQLALCQAERARVAGRASSAIWRPAREALDELGAIPQRAYARVRLAEALLAEGQRRQAADALNESIDLFAGAPQSPIRALAEQLGRRARLQIGRPVDDQAKPSSEDRFGLTERETEVLRLLSDGRTNREIGDALFISPKTVSVHVTSVMRKLGVRRRADAARIFRKSLLDPQRTR